MHSKKKRNCLEVPDKRISCGDDDERTKCKITYNDVCVKSKYLLEKVCLFKVRKLQNVSRKLQTSILKLQIVCFSVQTLLMTWGCQKNCLGGR